ncbi:glycosyltransferase family 4 protein [Intrasporangium sp. YIM S08009]|uniref:glycosyltransferase family 4 protein n=1 Tax=Intrasporangium zincisolvens TaxID=3080018 RepID=UPI002B062664|nr:glycosyltransferase family 4 protein [Intrasporangium sp. YIM S08009]
MPTLHAVLPDAVHDPARPSGGNTYDRRVLAGLADLGWTVREQLVAGRWPEPDAVGRRSLADAVGRVGAGAPVLVDGLLASRSPDVLVPLARRVPLVVLVHLPLGGEPERAVLAATAAVVTTSAWSRDRVVALHGLDPARVHIAEPGTDSAPLAVGSPGGGSLLCAGAVTPLKGLDVLADALATLTDLPWRCVVAGSLEVDAPFAAGVVERTRRAGVADRVTFAGPLTADALGAAYATADLLVAPSRSETFGMAVADALARGLPVVASDVGGLPQTVRGAGGPAPGLLVPAGDPAALAGALRAWLTDPGLRGRLRTGAVARRETLAPWSETARQVAAVLGTLCP